MFLLISIYLFILHISCWKVSRARVMVRVSSPWNEQFLSLGRGIIQSFIFIYTFIFFQEKEEHTNKIQVFLLKAKVFNQSIPVLGDGLPQFITGSSDVLSTLCSTVMKTKLVGVLLPCEQPCFEKSFIINNFTMFLLHAREPEVFLCFQWVEPFIQEHLCLFWSYKAKAVLERTATSSFRLLFSIVFYLSYR